jgi:hypothetical protein
MCVRAVEYDGRPDDMRTPRVKLLPLFQIDGREQRPKNSPFESHNEQPNTKHLDVYNIIT